MTNLAKLLTSVKQLVDNKIEKHIPRKGSPQILFDACWYALGSGGKRLRPALIATSCEALEGSPKDTVPAGVALEIAHNFFLIHDDIEDYSKLRRGKPSVHVKYGLPHGVNIGDYLFAKSIEACLGGAKIWGEAKTMKVLDLMSEMFTTTAEGQAAEIEARDRKLQEATMEWYEKTALKKTGYYTGGTPCAIGATIAGGDNSQVKILKKFGFAIGVAFQIQDDILNLTAPEGGKYGKTFADDIAEGKRTLILVHSFTNANKKERKLLKTLIGKKSVTIKEKKKVIAIMKKYNSLGFAKNYAKKMIREARELIREKIKPTSGRKKMELIADFFITREF